MNPEVKATMEALLHELERIRLKMDLRGDEPGKFFARQLAGLMARLVMAGSSQYGVTLRPNRTPPSDPTEPVSFGYPKE